MKTVTLEYVTSSVSLLLKYEGDGGFILPHEPYAARAWDDLLAII